MASSSSGDLQAKVLAEAKKSQVAIILLHQSGETETVTSAVTSSLLSDSNSQPGTFLRKCLEACRVRQDQEQAQKKLGKIRRAILTKVLHLLMNNDYLSSSMASLATDALVEDLDDSQLPSEVVLKLFGMCRGQIRENGPNLNTRWFRALKQVIVNLSCRDKIVCDNSDMDDDDIGAEMTGQEFRLKALRDLCAIDWRSRHSAAFCELFRELDESARLTSEEKSLLVSRLSSALRRLPPQEVPPLAHQMLEFSRDAGSSSLLLNDLAGYFNSKMEQIKEGRNVDQDSQESADLIGREEGECERSLLQAEGTVMFHLAHAARIGHPIHKDILKLLRCCKDEILFSTKSLDWNSILLSTIDKPANRQKWFLVDNFNSSSSCLCLLYRYDDRYN